MSKLINEDWEHAAYANDVMYLGEQDVLMIIEHQEWEQSKKQPAILTLEKPEKDENAYHSRSISRAHQKKL
jgi:hypothetical protein